jgi:hypothetical protein
MEFDLEDLNSISLESERLMGTLDKAGEIISIVESGGPSKSLMLALEDIDPVFVNERYPSSVYTEEQSEVFFDIAVEGVVGDFFELLGRAITAFFNGIIKIIEWILEKILKLLGGDPDAAKSKAKDNEEKVKKNTEKLEKLDHTAEYFTTGAEVKALASKYKYYLVVLSKLGGFKFLGEMATSATEQHKEISAFANYMRSITDELVKGASDKSKLEMEKEFTTKPVFTDQMMAAPNKYIKEVLGDGKSVKAASGTITERIEALKNADAVFKEAADKLKEENIKFEATPENLTKLFGKKWFLLEGLALQSEWASVVESVIVHTESLTQVKKDMENVVKLGEEISSKSDKIRQKINLPKNLGKGSKVRRLGKVEKIQSPTTDFRALVKDISKLVGSVNGLIVKESTFVTICKSNGDILMTALLKFFDGFDGGKSESGEEDKKDKDKEDKKDKEDDKDKDKGKKDDEKPSTESLAPLGGRFSEYFEA